MVRFLGLHPRGIDRLPNGSLSATPKRLAYKQISFHVSLLKSQVPSCQHFQSQDYSRLHLSHARLNRPLSSPLSHLRLCSSSDSRASPDSIPPQQLNFFRWRDTRMLCSPRQHPPREHPRLHPRPQSHSPRTAVGRSCRMVRSSVRAKDSTPLDLGPLCNCSISKIGHGRGRVFATDRRWYGDGCSYGVCSDER